jgi:hypothetical protein
MRPLLSLLLILPAPATSAALTRASVPSRATLPFAVPSAPSLGPAALAPSLQSLPLTPSLVPVETPSVVVPRAVTALPAALRPLAAAFPAAAEAPKPQAAAEGAAAAPAPAPEEENEAEIQAAMHAERTGRVKPQLQKLFDGTQEMRRPLEEVWVLGEQRFESTRALLTAAGSLPAAAPATYRYAHAPSAPVSRAARAGVSALSGAVIAAVLAAGFIGLAEGPHYLGRVLTGAAGLEPLLLAGVAVLVGAAAGAVVSTEGPPAGEDDGRAAISGTLELRESPIGPRPWFIARRGRETVVVDLLNHAFAEPLDEPELPEPASPVVSGLVGAAAGVAIALAQWIPLAQILILPALGPAVGAALGRALAGDSRLPWGVLGGVLGLGFPAIAIASFSSVSRIGMLATLEWYLPLFAVIGAVLGVLAYNAYREREALEAHRNPPSQWWASRPEQEAP